MRTNVNWDAQPLGEVADVELAKKLGVSDVAVGRARRRRKIPPYNRSRRPKKAAKKNKFSENEGEELRIRRREKIEAPPDDSIPKGPHVHRCPTCRKDTPCENGSCESTLDNEDGVPMIYTTCKVCINQLAKERNEEMVTIGSSSGRFGPMSRFR